MVQLIDQFIEYKIYNKGRSPRTGEKYSSYLYRLYDYLKQQGIELLQVDRKVLLEFSGLHAHKQGLSPRSRRGLVAALRGFYSWAKSEGHAKTNPAQYLEYPSAGMPLPTPATLKSAQLLMMAPDLETFVGVRDAAIFGLLIGAGLRVSGLVSMNESDLIWTTNADDSERLVLRVTEKGEKERYIPMPLESALLVRAYLGHPDLAAIDRTLKDGDRVLFVSIGNTLIGKHDYIGAARRISVRGVQERIKYYGQRCGVPGDHQHPHAFRHLLATELTESDEDINKIQALLGHADIKSTTIYVRLAVRKLAQTQDRSNPMRKIRTPMSGIAKAMESKK